MIIPIRCFTCGKVIGNKWEAYIELLRCEYPEGDALDVLGLKRYCCRRIRCYTAEIRHQVQALNPALFQLTINKDNSLTVHVEPKLDICEAFLAGSCHNAVRPCDKLHLCREFEHCTKRQCTFPHKFDHGQNQKIVEQVNCQNIDAQLLVKFIRLKKPARINVHRHSDFIQNLNQADLIQSNSMTDETDRQIDVSFPSSSYAPQIDMEIIEMSLSVENFRMEKKLEESENECFRRVTIQLNEVSDVDKLLKCQISTFSTRNIKFKRTKQFIDKASFVLKTALISEQDKIAQNRIRLYISLLVGNMSHFTLVDLSTANEQVVLVQCNNNIEFKNIYEQYRTKPQLKGQEMSLVQIYECDTVSMRFLDKKPMSYNDIENIVRPVRIDVFTYQLTDDNSAEVEFTNPDAYKNWMSNVDKIIAKFHVTVTPIITDIDERCKDEDRSISTPQSIPFHLPSPSTNKPTLTTITLRPDWAMVAAHRVFQIEYKEYIRHELGGEITVNGDQISYISSFPRLPRCSHNEAILANKTNNYMQKLRYQVLRDLKPYHVNTLRKYSNTVAYRRINQNDYSVAAKFDDLVKLKDQLFHKNKPRYQTDSNTTANHTAEYCSSATSSVPKQETAERRPSTSTASVVNNTSIYVVASPEEKSMFSLKTFETRLEQHLTSTYNVKITIERIVSNIKSKGDETRVSIKIIGEGRSVENALNDVEKLFASLRTQKFDDANNGNWTKMEEAALLIQHHLNREDLICMCQKISATVVLVTHFDVNNPQFGVNPQQIEDLINNQFSSATITHTPQSSSSQFTKDWMVLENTIRQRNDYKKDICLHVEQQTMYLFGLTKLVKEFHQMFEQLKNKYVPQSHKMPLTRKQLDYLTHVGIADLMKLEKRYKTDGCDVSLTRLQQHGDFLAPIDMHAQIEASLRALTEIDEISFEIQNSAFAILIIQQSEQLISLVKNKCLLQKKSRTQRIEIPIPKARGADLEDLAKQPQQAAAPLVTTSSVTIGNSTVTICTGDLTTQTVDIIVVCSTSEIMRNNIIAQAGAQVQKQYDAMIATKNHTGAASSGALPCKKIIFLPWQPGASNPHILKPSLSTFVTSAIDYAVKNQYKSIAFPSVGCGKLGFDPSIIAKHMIDETQEQLVKINEQLDVSFVLLPSQKNVFDEFVKHLNSIRSSRTTVPKPTASALTSTIGKTSVDSKVSYDEKITEITLISTNPQHLTKCKQVLLELAQSSLQTKQLTGKRELLDWSQSTINQFYNDCLKQHVKPTLDLDTFTVVLVGPRDAVHEAEKQFYELTTETYKQARNHAVSRGVIWSVEVSPGSDNWEQYSFKLNGMIEDAYLKKQPNLDFSNDKQERCRIVFNRMQEHHGSDVRTVRRKVVDSLLPDTWESSDQNCKRVTLQSSSKEYQDVLRQFNATMNGHYTKILRIERIQNERWYKQYAAHRDEYKRRYSNLDERLLFHGCIGTSADHIVQECFNRSFAGVNGVAYGHGVYFHTDASYSHSYAKPDGSGERTMFLARVLIGRTHVGNSQMKVPPQGYDTTTDGKNIFVVYHDAVAYADHLITYQ
ncbi:unnamed protein product [Adineta ricciae]|uniref:Poly [ADP-ribose] polymerase n=1 Tax=Adineta ricciae TaxID=249248 RepID=A0A814BMW0_ADIRI|nr:unnamed protein product [Adineta ricciae]